MAWPCWPSHQSPLTAWPWGQLNFPTAEWSLRCTALINAHGCCCSCWIEAVHISQAQKSLPCSHTDREPGKEMNKGREKRRQSMRKMRGKQRTNRKDIGWRTKTGPKTPTIRACTQPTLPSNLMIRVCSHFHSDRKGTMRKIEEAVRRKNKSDEDCYRPQRPPQSLSLCGSLCLTSTETMLIEKTSECNHLTFSKCTECSRLLSLTVQGTQADSLCWSSWPLSHILCTASSPNFCCQVDNSSKFKTIYNAIQRCKLSQQVKSLCTTIFKARGLKYPVKMNVQNY